MCCHEYATIPYIKEEVSEILLNVKSVRLRSEVDRPGKLRLEVSGEGEVCAGDIMASSDFQVVNPELHLATMDSAQAELSVELNVERGTGYGREAAHGDGQPIGVLPVDAVFTPIRKVSYTIEPTRVGQRADFERLVLEVWTDGSITPVEGVRQAANILVNEFFLFANVEKTVDDGGDGSGVMLHIPAEQYNIPVERLDLSSRTLNCLKRADVNKVGEVLEMKQAGASGNPQLRREVVQRAPWPSARHGPAPRRTSTPRRRRRSPNRTTTAGTRPSKPGPWTQRTRHEAPSVREEALTAYGPPKPGCSGAW